MADEQHRYDSKNLWQTTEVKRILGSAFYGKFHHA
ncbi:unnamed protein product, partial [Rotaria magnacalcarata]